MAEKGAIKKKTIKQNSKKEPSKRNNQASGMASSLRLSDTKKFNTKDERV